MQFALRRIIASGIFLCCGCEAPTAVQTPPAGLPAGSAPATSGSPTRSTPGSVSDNGSDAQAAKPALQVTRLPAQELDQGWISLFDGQTMFGWEAGSTANWQVQEGVLVVSEGEKGLLCTTSEFSDYMLRLEFRFAAGTNSGVFLNTPIRPTNPAVDCYELNIAEASVSEFSTGSFVNRQKTEVVAAPDAWHEFEVTMDGGHATVKLNGDLALDYTDPMPLGRGKIGLQLNQGRVEFRNLRIRPLQLVSLFNGKDLAGWTETPAGGNIFQVTDDGVLRAQGGKAQLESSVSLADFVLQLECKTEAPNLNSGVFFRCLPGEELNGYESQIHNGFRRDRTAPVDCGTGGIFRRSNARIVVANDQQWFHKTIVATGPNLAVWVDGFQVTDWTDMRARDPNPRKGRRLEAGTIMLQAHDETTDVSFRNLQAAELRPRPTP